MNPKLKSYLTAAWNEPRAFFGWLTLVSALIVGCCTLFVHGTNPQHVFSNPAPPTVQMIALFALLCFAGSFVIFFLTFIPPLRRLFSLMLKRRFFVIACLATLIALFYAAENWRGRRAWESFQNEWAVKGERFDEASVIPQTVADSENFFMTGPWERFRFHPSKNNLLENDQDHDEPVLDIYGPSGSRGPGLSDLPRGTRADFSAWQSFYRGTNNSFSGTNGSFTNYFPVSANPQSPARDVLLALTRYDETLRLLHEAARRPKARFWINYEDGFAMRLPHLAKMKGCTTYLALHATASLAEGDSETAFNDTQLSFRLGESINSEPILNSFLVEVAMSQIRAGVIWEGLADHRWTDVQLAALGGALAKENHLENYRHAMRGERAFCNGTFDMVRRTRDWGFMMPDQTTTQGSLLELTLGNSLFRLVPGGWFDQNKVSMSRMHMLYVQPSVDVEKHVVSPTASRQLSAQSERQAGAVHPYNIFTRFLFPALERASEKAARGQSICDLTQVACALERHHIAHGNYPETLDALVPQFISKLPNDVINGQPLKYRRSASDSFVLYSVGWNEKDDGGSVVLTKDGRNVNVKEGDWVWAGVAK